MWELSIKIRLGKPRTLTSPVAFIYDSLKANNVAVLPVRYEDILSLEHLPTHHRDPFDRILIAQALANGYKLLSEDVEVRKYEGFRLFRKGKRVEKGAPNTALKTRTNKFVQSATSYDG